MFDWLTNLWATRSPNTVSVSLPYNVTARDSRGGVADRFIEDTRAFNNRVPDSFGREKAEANEIRMKRAKAGTVAFRQIMENKRVAFKWVVTVYGDLYIIPIEDRKRDIGIDLKHSVAADGLPVFTAGTGGPQWNKVSGRVIVAIDNWSGHYHPTEASVIARGVGAWKKAGYDVEIYDKAVHRSPMITELFPR